MGIRVRKHLGYGLKNLRVTKTGVPKDPRWDYEKYSQRWRDVEQERSLAEYLQWVLDHKERLMELLDAERGVPGHASTDHFLLAEALNDQIERKTSWVAPYDALTWDNDFGLKKVVMLIPAERHHEWRRHDNIIDYYEEQDYDLTRRATLLKGRSGIFPGSRTRTSSPTSRTTGDPPSLSAC